MNSTGSSFRLLPSFLAIKQVFPIIVALLTALASTDSCMASCSACLEGEVTVKFCADANLIKGTAGSVAISLTSTHMVSVASAPASGPGGRPYEPPDGTVGSAGTDWGTIKLKKNVPVSGVILVSPTGIASDYVAPGSCIQGTVLCQFRTSCLGDLVFEFYSELTYNDGETGWREVNFASFKYDIPDVPTEPIPIKIRVRERNNAGGEGETEDDTGEETTVSGPSIPEDKQDAAPGSGGQPQEVNPAGFYSSIPIRGGDGSEEFYVGSFDLTGVISSSMASVAHLKVRHPDGEDVDTPPDFDVVRASGLLRQVRTLAALYDIVPVTGGGFEIKTYESGDFGTTPDGGGIYPVNGGASPSSSVRYTPVAAAGTHFGGVKITRTSKDATVRAKEILATTTTGDGWRIVENGLETHDYMTIFDYVGGKWRRVELETVMREGILYSKSQRTSVYQVRREGSENKVVESHLFLIEEIVHDTPTTTLKTTYVPDPDFLGKARSVLYPDGSWVAYRYYTGTEPGAVSGMQGLLKETLRPWNGAPASPAAATSANSESTVVIYDVIAGDEGVGYQAVEEATTLPDVGVTRKWKLHPGFVPVGSLLYLLEVEAGLSEEWAYAVRTRDDSRRIYISSTKSIIHNSLSYRTRGTSGEPWDGRAFASVDSEGNGTVTGFERGGFNVGTGVFTPDSDPGTSDGAYIRSITTQVVDEGYELAPLGESTKEVRIEEIGGRELRRELWIRTGTGAWALATVTTFEYTEWPDGSLKETVVKHDGRIVSRSLQVSGTENHQWDEQGIETRTLFDELGRVVSVTTAGVPALGNYEAQPDRVVSYQYLGRRTIVTQSAGSLARIEESLDDLAGRNVAQVDASGATTITSYPNGGRNTLVTLPGGATRLTTRNIDRKTVSVTGTAVVDERYEYEALTGGNLCQTRRTGNFAESPRYTRTETDWAGRTIRISSPSPTEIGEVTLTYHYAETPFYEPTRRLVSITSSASNVAPVLFQKVSLKSGAQYSGYDSGSDGLTPASKDRMTESRTEYAHDGGYWWRVSTTKQYDVDDSAASAITSIIRECLHGVPGAAGTAAKSVRIAPSGETTTTTVIDRTDKTRTETTVWNGSTIAAVAVNYNGLVVSHSGHDSATPTVWKYNALGQPVKETSPRGAVAYTYYRADGRVGSTTDQYGKVTHYDYHGTQHVAAGQLAEITRPDGTTETYAYSPAGQLIETAGTAAYRVTYEYDAYGDKKKMFTWRTPSASDATEWVHQPGTGLLKEKIHADGKKTVYTYHASGKMATRVWARGVTTTYTYNAYGDLTDIGYSDATPDVALSNLDRLGRPGQVAQSGIGSEILTYHPGKGVQNARYFASGHTLLPLRGMRSTAPDSAGRSAGFDEVSVSESTLTSVRTVSYSYDSAGRLGTISDGTQHHVYGYHANSSQVFTLESRSGSSPWFRETRHTDVTGRLIGILSNRMSGGTLVARIATHSYDYDENGRRVRSTQQDGSRWEYAYNDRSEIIGAVRKDASGNVIPQLGSSYTYDGIGNRLTSASDVLGDRTYTSNQLNQYATIASDDGLTAIGRAPAAWTVQVNGVNASRMGEIYYRDLTASNGIDPVWQSVETKRIGGTPAPVHTGHLWYPAASVSPQYDLDGNLVNDGRWVYTWDAENRLIQMDTTTEATDAGHPFTRLKFSYDWQGRRIARTVWKGGTSGSPTFSTARRWIYDGWNPIVEFSATEGGALTRANTFTWGSDLSGTSQGAGGVGGLIVQTEVSGGVIRRASYDGNGNIVAWTRSDQSAPDYRREYDAFGNVLVSEGTTPPPVDFGFSTKMRDPGTGLYYYGYRYYDPVTGRWPSRDPIEEEGGINLYGFVGNDSIDSYDYLGMLWKKYRGPAPVLYKKFPPNKGGETKGDWTTFKIEGPSRSGGCVKLTLTGELKVTIYLNSTPGSQNFRDRLGNDPYTHEQVHEKINEKWANHSVDNVNPIEGFYCRRSCARLAKDWGYAVLRFHHSLANIANIAFDNYAYDAGREGELAKWQAESQRLSAAIDELKRKLNDEKCVIYRECPL